MSSLTLLDHGTDIWNEEVSNLPLDLDVEAGPNLADAVHKTTKDPNLLFFESVGLAPAFSRIRKIQSLSASRD